MPSDQDIYDDSFVYRPRVEPTQDVVPVALVYGSVAPPSFIPYPNPRYALNAGMQTQNGGMQ